MLRVHERLEDLTHETLTEPDVAVTVLVRSQVTAKARIDERHPRQSSFVAAFEESVHGSDDAFEPLTPEQQDRKVHVEVTHGNVLLEQTILDRFRVPLRAADRNGVVALAAGLCAVQVLVRERGAHERDRTTGSRA